MRFLTNKAIPTLAALLIVPFPCQVEVVVVGQNSTQWLISKPTEPLVLLGVQNIHINTHIHTNPFTVVTEKAVS